MMSTQLFECHRQFLLCVLLLVAGGTVYAQGVPTMDSRLGEPRHLDLPYTFPDYHSKDEWLARAAKLRKQILVSAGLWPMPQRPPIKASIFDKADHGDYTVEKVYFESYPGFYVSGNLYRPKTTDPARKFPAVLCPHGHWTYGRLENTPLNSGPARAISFAKQGYVAFSYDMVGYVDSAAISHKFADHNVTGREALWGVNLLGLQLWDSIRSIDFLLTLPEVDAERIACTGESGGGTQTFLLTAVDDRVKVAAPVNMVSFIMQGGSLCENAPNLRIDTNNVEIAALMAPRPMMLVSATGDWTKNMLTSEFPAVRNIYRLLGAEDKLTAIQVNAPHNYNQESREAVYGWFAHWMLERPEATPIKERTGGLPALSELMVFFGRPRPANELNETQLAAFLIESRKKQFAEALPRDAASLQQFKDRFGEALKYSLMADAPIPNQVVSSPIENVSAEGATTTHYVIARQGHAERIQVSIHNPAKSEPKSFVLVLSAAELLEGEEATQAKRNRDELVASLMQKGQAAVTINCFPAYQQTPTANKYKFFTTYNRTDAANRVQDMLTTVAFLQQRLGGTAANPDGKTGLRIVALDRAGAWALLARGLAPRFDRMMVDAAQFDASNDEEYLKWLPIPGIRRAGDFTTAVAIAPLTPLRIYNAGDRFPLGAMTAIYRHLGRAADFQTQSNAPDIGEMTTWLTAR